MTDCLFCRIATGEIPAQVVFDNEHVVAFRDVDPQAPVHVLVIPRAHIGGVGDAAEDRRELLGELLLAATEVARREGVAGSGYRLVINNGRDANQTVPHLHVHVLGGRHMGWPPG